MRLFRHSLLIVIGVINLSISAWAQDAAVVAEDAAPQLVTRFYDITLLTTSRQQFPFDDGSANRPGAMRQMIGGFGGGQAGGMGGGGGSFSLPVEPAQFGGGAAQVQSVESALMQQLEEQGESISNLIVNHIELQSWTNSGAGTGEIIQLGNTLMIRQTESVQQQVAEFLKSLTNTAIGTGTYQVEAWWLPTTEPGTMQLKNLLNGNLELATVLEELAALCQDEGGYHGTLLCRDRVTTHMASGKTVPVIIGSTPVVGTGSTGYSPTTQILHLGLMLEARVTSVPDYLASEVDGEKSEQVELNFRSHVTNSDAQIQERSVIEKIDRYELGEHRAAGSCRVLVGTPTLIGSLTQLSNQEPRDTEIPPELHLVVRVTRIAD